MPNNNKEGMWSSIKQMFNSLKGDQKIFAILLLALVFIVYICAKYNVGNATLIIFGVLIIIAIAFLKFTGKDKNKPKNKGDMVIIPSARLMK